MKHFLLCTVASLSLVAIAPPQVFRLSRNSAVPPSAPHFSYDVTAGDVDADGDQDLVIGNDHGDNLLLLNDGRGTFVDATIGRLVTPTVPGPQVYSNATYEVDLADIDGDGDLDLLLVNDHLLPNRAYVNDGLGTFTDVTATASTPTNEDHWDQVVADFDGDGDVDWLVIGYPSRLYQNNGLGVFTDVSTTHLPGASNDFTRASFAADLDGDGDLDVLMPKISFPLKILVNQGGVLTTAGAPVLTGNLAGHAFAADVDGDGLVDLCVNDYRLMRNHGAATFVDESAARLPAGWNQPLVAAFDADGDGDVDLLGRGALLRNDGQGFFSPSLGLQPSSSYPPLLPYPPCIVDIDGDRDQDLVDSYFGALGGAWVNFSSQAHTPAPPVVGNAYAIEFHSPISTTPVLLAPGVATGGALLTLPGFAGTFRLDPVTAVPLWVLFSTTGLDTITWTIPNVPALVGTELHYQAAVLDPLRPAFLGNAIRDVIQ